MYIFKTARWLCFFSPNGTLTRFALVTLILYVRFRGAFKAAAGELALHSTCTLLSERPAIHWGEKTEVKTQLTQEIHASILCARPGPSVNTVSTQILLSSNCFQTLKSFNFALWKRLNVLAFYFKVWREKYLFSVFLRGETSISLRLFWQFPVYFPAKNCACQLDINREKVNVISFRRLVRIEKRNLIREEKNSMTCDFIA